MMDVLVYTRMPSGSFGKIHEFNSKEAFDRSRVYYDLVYINELKWRIRSSSDTVPWIHVNESNDPIRHLIVEVEKPKIEENNSEMNEIDIHASLTC